MLQSLSPRLARRPPLHARICRRPDVEPTEKGALPLPDVAHDGSDVPPDVAAARAEMRKALILYTLFDLT